jgi:hypothetical protein
MTRFHRAMSDSIVCSQSRKRRVLRLRGGRDDIADFDGTFGDDHAVDQQFEQGPLPLEFRRSQALLHTPAERLGVRGQAARFVRPLGIPHEILLLTVQGQ